MPRLIEQGRKKYRTLLRHFAARSAVPAVAAVAAVAAARRLTIQPYAALAA